MLSVRRALHLMENLSQIYEASQVMLIKFGMNFRKVENADCQDDC